MMCMLHQATQRSGATYETVKDHFLHKIQETLQYGIDLAGALRRMEYGDKDFGPEPVRRVVDTPKLGVKGGDLD